MTDRHKYRPVTYRPSPDDWAWVLAYAEATGQAGPSEDATIRRHLGYALTEYRAAHSGVTTELVESPQVESPQPVETPQQAKVETPVETPRKRQPRPKEHTEDNSAKCAHSYPDVRYVAGQRICRKCPATSGN